MLEQVSELKREMEEVKREAAEMRAEVSAMRQRMMEVEKRPKDENETETNSTKLSSEVETSDHINDKKQMKRIIAAIKKNKKRVMKLECKYELMMDMMERKEHNESNKPPPEVTNKIKLEESLKMKETKMKDIEADDVVKCNDENVLVDKMEQLEQNKTVTLNERMFLELKAMLDVKLTEIKVEMEKINSAQLSKVNEIGKLNAAKLSKVYQKLTKAQVLSSFDLINKTGNFQPDFTAILPQNKFAFGRIKFSESGAAMKWPGYPVLATVITAYETIDSVCVTLQLQPQTQEKLQQIKLVPNVYFVVRDESGNSVARHRCENVFHLSKTFSWEYKFATHVRKEDNKSLEIYLEPFSTARQVQSFDGNLDWTIDNFRKRKQMEREGVIVCQESPYFYTGPKGYRVQVHLKLSGTAKVSFLTGEFDENLNQPFPHQLTITLVNQMDPNDNFIRTAKKDIPKERCYDFNFCNDNDVLYAVENDSLIVKVTVKPIEINA